MSDEDLAVAIAELAGEVLCDLSASSLWVGDQRGRIAELTANRLILAALAKHRPDDRILSEEGDGARKGNSTRCWIVDPLDGTREYCEGRDDWATQVGLACNGRAAAGVVFLPRIDVLLRSDEPPRLRPIHTKIRIVVSRTRPAAEAQQVATRLGANLIPMGSAGAKVAALLAGEAEIYLHSGGQSQWDSCAPVAIALAAGFDATRLNGEPLVYGGADAEIPDLVISHPGVTGQLRDALATVRQSAPEAAVGHAF